MELILTALLIPLVLALVPLVWKDLISPRFNRDGDDDAADVPPVMQGQPLDLTDVAVAALQGQVASVTAQLEDEQADHARCDALLRAHNVQVPHD